MILKFLNPLTKAISIIALMSFLNACSSSDNVTTAGSTKTTTALPLAAFTIPDRDNTLSAHIILDGDISSPISMTIDFVAGTATANITGLTLELHTVQIIYEYNDGITSYILAESSVHTYDLTNGSIAPQSISDYTFNDDDSDGLSNALELAAGTNPGDSGCVLGISIVGSCTL